MNEEYFELSNFYKKIDNILSSTYYYAIEKYKNICEEIRVQIWKEEFLKFRNQYNNPVKFAEDYLGFKLMWYQKILLKMACKKETLLYRMGIRRVLK